ncbi:winged helix-turn-helix domain-containing protein [Natranaeroarchaeum sulfidigenes]|uniref:Transcriptional regulator containing HTH domain,ArsR family n=1 Tax=Natranaeroarchaeum sulfidigenes TaxID=2784880 RepID=A0A897MU22_9EURY|nr:helix-turn-helix domain-containing protein [Natranaeroarchaeum sulfidigenes]QSG04012.1 Transcriptional regulator containing HTH domain,ArsR family [Natranaeroarchaeum sulfidigenes]
MSRTYQHYPDGGIDERELGECFDSELVVELLDDAEAVRLFQTAADPMTIQQLAEECDVSQSTAYRKVDKLTEAGLLVETTEKRPDGDPPARYKRRAPAVTVTIGEDVEVVCADLLPDRLSETAAEE